MKKLLVIGIALAFGLNACTLGFGPVPPAPDGWAYQIQSRLGDITGDILCPFDDATYEGWELASAAVNEALNNNLPASWYPKCVEVPFGTGIGKAYIESLLPYWTLNPDNGDPHWTASIPSLASNLSVWNSVGGWASFTPEDITEDGSDMITWAMKDGSDVMFTISWKERVIDFGGFGTLAFPWPKFNGEVIFERVDPTFAGLFIFVVHGADMWNHGHRYTAIPVQFGTLESARTLMFDEFDPDYVVELASSPSWNYRVDLPKQGGNFWNEADGWGIATFYDIEWSWTDGKAEPAAGYDINNTFSATHARIRFNEAEYLYLTATFSFDFLGETYTFTKDFVFPED